MLFLTKIINKNPYRIKFQEEFFYLGFNSLKNVYLEKIHNEYFINLAFNTLINYSFISAANQYVQRDFNTFKLIHPKEKFVMSVEIPLKEIDNFFVLDFNSNLILKKELKLKVLYVGKLKSEHHETIDQIVNITRRKCTGQEYTQVAKLYLDLFDLENFIKK